MPRAKKDGEKISIYIDKETSGRIRTYAESKGQTLTMAIERAINGFLDNENYCISRKDDISSGAISQAQHDKNL